MLDLNLIFEEMSSAISEACRTENYSHATSRAEQLGMVREGNQSPFSLRYDYRIGSSQNDYVRFHFRSYDQSQAFSIRPDMNKFELELVLNGKSAKTTGSSYED